MKYIFTLLSVAACIALFNSCDKEMKCEDNGTPIVSVNAEVAVGETINLSVTGVDNVYMYRWTGPNNFSSKEQSPVIQNASPYNSGIYTVDVITNDGCIMRSQSDSIAVAGSLPTCYLAENTGDFPNAQYVDFYSIRHYWGDYSVEFRGSSNLGAISLTIIPRDKELTPGIYNIVEDHDYDDYGIAMLSLNFGSINMEATGGRVVVTKINGKYKLECCEIPFTYTASQASGKLTGSLSLMED